MLQQNHAERRSLQLRFNPLRATPRQLEARHDVRHDNDSTPINFADAGFAVVRVRDCKEGVGMRVIDEFMGNDGVQNRFDGRRGRTGAGNLCRQFVHHFRVRQVLQRGQLQQVRHSHRRKSIHLDRFEVPSAAFHIKNIFFLADDVLLAHFHRSVATAVEHKRVVPPEQARGVNTQLEIRPALGRVRGIPKVLHRAPCIEQMPAELPMAKAKPANRVRV